MALADARSKFLFVDIGSNGSCADQGISRETNVAKAVAQGNAGFPDPSPIPNDDHPLEHFFVGDDAFALRPDMMKPYPRLALSDAERVYNYRLSRARRVVENAFGLLQQRFVTYA